MLSKKKNKKKVCTEHLLLGLISEETGSSSSSSSSASSKAGYLGFAPLTLSAVRAAAAEALAGSSASEKGSRPVSFSLLFSFWFRSNYYFNSSV